MAPVRVDLHIHSTASDGRWSPDQVVHHVRQAGIDLFAVADHDSVGNVRAVEREARGSGLGFIRAVEISTTLEEQLFHILAYGIHPEHPDLLRILAENEAKMESVDRQSIHKLIEAGHEISFEEYEAYEDDPTRGGWKALNLFIDRGICRDVDDFFGRLFAGEMALHMPAFPEPEEAASVIRAAGGVAVCAHPGYSTREGGAALLDELVGRGIAGMECFSPYHDQATTDRLVDYCRRNDLLITAGSDTHGGFVNRAVGQPEAYVHDLNLGPLLAHVIR